MVDLAHWSHDPLPPGPAVFGVIACGAVKAGQTCQAQELYTGRHFRLCRRYIERQTQRWAILSAKHLVLHPEALVDPYDARMPTGRRAVHDPGGVHYRCAMWLGSVFHLADHPGSHVIVLAGTDYLPTFTIWARQFLRTATWSTPLAGKGIGEQDSWLAKQLQAPAPLPAVG